MCAGLKNDSQRGLVEMAVTKHLTALQALLDWRAQSKHLSIYEQIELSERGKQHNALGGAGRNPKAQRQNASSWHPNNNRPADTAMYFAGHGVDL
jgi:hypothetical protein